MSDQLSNGTGAGLMDFLEYLVDRGYGTPGAVNPLKSAVNQVFSKTEGEEYDLAEADVRAMDVESYLDRFATKARGSYKQESIAAYRKRFARAVDYYRAFLDDGAVPRFGARTSAGSSGGKKPVKPQPKHAPVQAPDVPSSQGPTGSPLVDFPFPLDSGQMAYVRLPQRFEQADAERMGAFLLTLVTRSEAPDGEPHGPDA